MSPVPWPRRMAAVAVLVLVAVLIVHYLPRSRHGTARPARRLSPWLRCRRRFLVRFRVTRGWQRNPTESQARSCPGLAVFGCRRPESGRCGSGRTGQVLPIGGLPPQRSGYQFIRAAGGWAVQADPGAQAVCGSCAGPRRAVYFLADRGQSATRAGLAERGRPRRVWHAVADQLPPRCRFAHVRRYSAGSQHHWPAARATVQASDRVPDRAGDQSRPAAGTSGPASGGDGRQVVGSSRPAGQSHL